MLLRRLDRLFLRQIAFSIAVIAPTVLAMIWLIEALRLTESSIRQGWSAFTLLWLLLLLIWRFVDVLLPLAVFVAVVSVLLAAEDQGELAAAQSLGAGPMRLLRSVFAAAAAVALLSMANATWVAPRAYGAFLEIRAQRSNDIAAAFLRPGTFTQLDAGLTIWMRDLDRRGGIRDLVLYDTRRPGQENILHAESGRLTAGEGGLQLALFQGTQLRSSPPEAGGEGAGGAGEGGAGGAGAEGGAGGAGAEGGQDGAPRAYWARFQRHDLFLERPPRTNRRLHRIELSLAELFAVARLPGAGGESLPPRLAREPVAGPGGAAGAGASEGAGDAGGLSAASGLRLGTAFLGADERRQRRGEFLAEAHRRLAVPLWPFAFGLLGATAVLARRTPARRRRLALYFTAAFLLMLANELWLDFLADRLPADAPAPAAAAALGVVYLLPGLTALFCALRLLALDRALPRPAAAGGGGGGGEGEGGAGGEGAGGGRAGGFAPAG